jgi:NAD+---dinitrogen-reductase ADP-D-ribosyltransferase
VAQGDVGIEDEPGQPRTWYSTNLVGVPAEVLACPEFNAHPRPLHIGGTRASHAGLFSLLDNCASAFEASEVFVHYMSLAFGLQPSDEPANAGEARRWRASYHKLLQGWGLDSNGPAGAVLKGWVESRFGLVPCFHKARLDRFPSPAWVSYLEEKASSRYHNNCIYQQLDLLYEFCQWAVVRFLPFGAAPRVALWRGFTRGEEQVVQGEWGRTARQLVVRLNNLVSFAVEQEQAECFGDWLLQAEVPLPKLLFYPGLLPTAPLSGEGEVLAIGGDYDVKVRHV